MGVLIISDYPDNKLFRQILILKNEVENLTKKQVDLITFSSLGVFLNRKQIITEIRKSTILNLLHKNLKRKTYLVYIISLTRKYLELILPAQQNILDLINKISPNATVFIFGASSILNDIKIEQKVQHVFFYPRPGVNKLTKEFKKRIIGRIKTIKFG